MARGLRGQTAPAGRQSGGAAKIGVIMAKIVVTWEHQASHDFWGE